MRFRTCKIARGKRLFEKSPFPRTRPPSALTLAVKRRNINGLLRPNHVTPAKAGVQNIVKRLDSGFRRNDGSSVGSSLS